MPLTTRERIGSRRLLESLDTADLLSLAGTVTKKKSTACTRAEAIDTILQNSKNASELLNRRKVLCDIIAAYLKKEGVPIPSKITKTEVIQKTLAHWSEPGSGIAAIPSPERFGCFDYDLYNNRAIGLSAQERDGCRKVLKSLDVLAISSLACTVSKKKSSAEEIDIILEKSKSAYELLNRKKVIRDAIAAYLKSEGVPISSNITKAEVVQKALVYWNELDSELDSTNGSSSYQYLENPHHINDPENLPETTEDDNLASSYCFQNDPCWGADKKRPAPTEDTEGRLNNASWCKCGNCTAMSTVEESICCQEFAAITKFATNVCCVCASPKFYQYVLEKDHLIYLARMDRVLRFKTEEKYNNRTFRFAAYRSFTALIYGYLEEGQRVPIPSCVVTRIRNSYYDPNGHYTGFKWFSQYSKTTVPKDLNF